jgi:hypothetical protein
MMHDWTLVRLIVDWLKGMITIVFKNDRSEETFLVAEGFSNLKVPKQEAWGESASVNEVEGPRKLDNGWIYISIEIQSGDKIELEAKSITLPDMLSR